MTDDKHPVEPLYPHRGSWGHASWCGRDIAVRETKCVCGLDGARRSLVRQEAADTSGLRAAVEDALTALWQRRRGPGADTLPPDFSADAAFIASRLEEAADTSGLRAAARAVVDALPVDGRTLHAAVKALEAALSQEPTPDERPLDGWAEHERQSNAGTHLAHPSECPFCFFDHFDIEERARLSAAGEDKR